MTVKGGDARQEDARGSHAQRRESLSESPRLAAAGKQIQGTAVTAGSGRLQLLEGTKCTAAPSAPAPALTPADQPVRREPIPEDQEGVRSVMTPLEAERKAVIAKLTELTRGTPEFAVEVLSALPILPVIPDALRVSGEPIIEPTVTSTEVSAETLTAVTTPATLHIPLSKEGNIIISTVMSKANYCPPEEEMQSDTQSLGGSRNISALEVTPDIRQLSRLIQALPTKEDIQKMLLVMTSTLKEEMEEVRAKVVVGEQKICVLESQQIAVDCRLVALEERVGKQQQQLVRLQLKAEEADNRSRRNNVRIRGIPESFEGPAPREAVLSILNKILKNSPESPLELDRVHKVPTYWSPEQNSPRDVLCRIHFFRIKEEILREAWKEGTVSWEGASIQLFPDLCWQTKARRRLLRPLLELIRRQEALYRWGYPLSLNVKKEGRNFYLREPSQLPSLFEFLGTTPVEVPNWLDLPGAAERDAR